MGEDPPGGGVGDNGYLSIYEASTVFGDPAFHPRLDLALSHPGHLLLWPVLIVAYVWLAKQEEKQALEDFGEAYGHYAKVTKRFIPYVA